MDKVGQRSLFGEERKQEYRILNHTLCGHSLLNDHRARINSSLSNLCDDCQVPETIEHFLFEYDKYSGQRESLKDGVLRVVTSENLQCGDIDIKAITGNVENISKSGEAETVNAVLNYIQETQGFVN